MISWRQGLTGPQVAELVPRGIRAQGCKTQALESEFCLPTYPECDHVPAAQLNPTPEPPMCGKDTTYLVSERSGEVTPVQCKGQVWLLAPHPIYYHGSVSMDQGQMDCSLPGSNTQHHTNASNENTVDILSDI